MSGIKMPKQIGRECRAMLLLLATLQLTSAATFMHGNADIPPPPRHQLMVKVYGDMGSIMKCLLNLQRPEVNDKISKVWQDHLDRIQLHPTKPASPSVSIDIFYEKQKASSNQLQAIDTECSIPHLQCDKDVTESDPKELIDMATSLTALAHALDCVLKERVDRAEINRIFDNSFERMHSNYDATTALQKVYEENLQTIKEIKDLSEYCMKN